MANPINPLPYGVGSIVGYVLGSLSFAFGLTWLLVPMFLKQSHTQSDTIVGGIAMLIGFLFVAPASSSAAISIVKPLVPWKVSTPPDEDKK